MSGTYEKSLLLDFYGELLTDKQRDCFDLHYNEDLSLAEIAEQLGISRQGVWDNIRRAEASMQDMEEKTGIISRFLSTRRSLEELRKMIDALSSSDDPITKKTVPDIQKALDAVLDTL